MNKDIVFRPIGTIFTPHKQVNGMPIQTIGALGVPGEIHLNTEYLAGLKDLDGFSHIILIYHLNMCNGYALEVTPFLDNEKHGIFATRSPKRPCPIGLSVVKLILIEGNIIKIENVDMLDQTPLLDIKPYVPEFDCVAVEKTGWLASKAKDASNKISDGRFK